MQIRHRTIKSLGLLASLTGAALVVLAVVFSCDWTGDFFGTLRQILLNLESNLREGFDKLRLR